MTLSVVFVIDPEGPRPVYQQIADLIEQQIRAGELVPGRVIPSESSICQEHGVARNTARRAVEELRDRGLVFTVPHRGTYVHPRSEWPD
jgi:DNA-binding GntR family transcriptional regulator